MKTLAMNHFQTLVKCVRTPSCICLVRSITRASNAVSLPSDLNDAFEASEIKHRQHPGVRKRLQVKLPEKLLAAASKVLEYPQVVKINPEPSTKAPHRLKRRRIKHRNQSIYAEDMSQLREAALLIRNQLWSRHLPTEHEEVRSRAMSIERELLGNSLERMSPEEREYIEEDVKRIVFEKLKKRIRLWKPIKYDDFGARGYLVARLAADYAVVNDVFNEIRQLHPAFSPASVMDFGSGVGTCFWAARNSWPKEFQEYFSIDISNHMHELARLLASGGAPNADPKFRSFFQREFLPASDTVTFDLVVSAFTLFDLPNAQQRLETVANLWGKTNGLLVLIENGTQAGHRAITEARDFILMISKDSGQEVAAKVLAPCPHDLECPRDVQALGIPCTFEARYEEPLFTPKRRGAVARYSYVVLQKAGDIPKEREWARIIRPVLCRKRHVICRLCCADASLKEFVFTKTKHGRHVYRVARSSRWGDQLPIDMLPPEEEGMPVSAYPEDDVDSE